MLDKADDLVKRAKINSYEVKRLNNFETAFEELWVEFREPTTFSLVCLLQTP